MIKTDKNKDIKIMYFDLETVTLEDPELACTFWQLSGTIEINGKAVEDFNFFVNPDHTCEYNADTLTFCGITEDQIAAWPHHEEIYDKFIEIMDRHVNKFDKNDKMFICGYNNIKFDNGKFYEWFKLMDKIREHKYITHGSYFWTNPLDVFPFLSLVFIKYRGLFPNFKLSTVAMKLAEMDVLDKKFLDEDNWHDAAFDIEATRALMHFCIEAFGLKIFEE